jgi:urea carboxylase
MQVRTGDRVERGAVIAIIEAMKTECDVHALSTGRVTGVYAKEGQPIAPGAALVAIEAE